MFINRRQLKRMIQSVIFESKYKDAISGAERIPKPGEGALKLTRSGEKAYLPAFGGKRLLIRSRDEKPVSVKIFAADESGAKSSLMYDLSGKGAYRLPILNIQKSTKAGVIYVEFTGRGLLLSTTR